MIKSVLFLSLISVVSFVWGNSNFTEKRYSYALDKTTLFKGNMSMDDVSTTVRYLQPERKTLTQSGKQLIIENVDAQTTQTIDLSDRIDMVLYFSFMRSAYRKDLSGLKTYFEVNREKNTLTLLPKKQVKRAIEKIVMQMNGDEVQTILINFTNRDTIEIETY